MIGASGSGKSTLLRCINHLEAPSAGDILIDGESLLLPAGDPDGRPQAAAAGARSTASAATSAWCSSSSTSGRT